MKHSFLIIIVCFLGCSQLKGKTEIASITQQKDSIIRSERYETGELKYIVYAKDSLDCEELHIDYYKNKTIKSKGCQGHIGAYGVPVGEWFEYDPLGNILEKREYKYNEKENFVVINKYDHEGKIKKEIILSYDPHYGEGDTLKVILPKH